MLLSAREVMWCGQLVVNCVLNLLSKVSKLSIERGVK